MFPTSPFFISRRGCLRTWLPLLLLVSGCQLLPSSQPEVAIGPLPNPLEIPVDDHDFVWNQIVDTVDDYFPIGREQRVQLVGDVLTEGRIETLPVPGATVLEPWRKDRTRGFELWHGTLQSIRRRAEVVVTPARAGYGVAITVRKELEDLARPELATVGGTIQRYDGGLIRPGGPTVGGPVPLGWIPAGRDVALEQKMLADLHRRIHQVAPPPDIQIMHR